MLTCLCCAARYCNSTCIDLYRGYDITEMDCRSISDAHCTCGHISELTFGARHSNLTARCVRGLVRLAIIYIDYDTAKKRLKSLDGRGAVSEKLSVDTRAVDATYAMDRQRAANASLARAQPSPHHYGVCNMLWRSAAQHGLSYSSAWSAKPAELDEAMSARARGRNTAQVFCTATHTP